MSTQSKTLADALPEEMERVRELIPSYEAIGPAGAFALMMIKGSLKAAEVASAHGDTVAMLRALQDLQGYKS